MKILNKLFLLVFVSTLAVSCSDDEQQRSVPVIDSLTVEASTVLLGDSIYFDAQVSDAIRPLSTLEVELIANGEVIESKSIRTKGNAVNLDNTSFFIPFMPNVKSGDELSLNFTLINVDGDEAKVEKKLTAKRPNLPSTLYLVMSDQTVIELTASSDNPDIYESEEGNYPSIFDGKVATESDLELASYIWNGGSEDNHAVIGERFGTDIHFSYSSWVVEKIIFNAQSFVFDKKGIEVNIVVNGKQLTSSGGYLYSSIDFVKDAEFELTGISDLQRAYNRDFMEYDATTGKVKFLGETGTWDIFYSLEYNYLWVNKMSAVAPTTYWVIGHGFSSIPRWYSSLNPIGWDLDDVKQLAYMKSLGSNKYQATVYLSDQHDWGGFDIQIFSNRTWDAKVGVFDENSFTGDATGVSAAGGAMADIVGGEGFVPGYYRLTLDISEGLDKAKIHFERLQ